MVELSATSRVIIIMMSQPQQNKIEHHHLSIFVILSAWTFLDNVCRIFYQQVDRNGMYISFQIDRRSLTLLIDSFWQLNDTIILGVCWHQSKFGTRGSITTFCEHTAGLDTKKLQMLLKLMIFMPQLLHYWVDVNAYIDQYSGLKFHSIKCPNFALDFADSGTKTTLRILKFPRCFWFGPHMWNLTKVIWLILNLHILYHLHFPWN